MNFRLVWVNMKIFSQKRDVKFINTSILMLSFAAIMVCLSCLYVDKQSDEFWFVLYLSSTRKVWVVVYAELSIAACAVPIWFCIVNFPSILRDLNEWLWPTVQCHKDLIKCGRTYDLLIFMVSLEVTLSPLIFRYIHSVCLWIFH